VLISMYHFMFNAYISTNDFRLLSFGLVKELVFPEKYFSLSRKTLSRILSDLIYFNRVTLKEVQINDYNITH